MSDLAQKTVKGSIWSGVDIIARQGIGFVINLILARLLCPSDYGIIGVVLVFTSIMDVIVDGGFSVGLIRKKDRTDLDCSTAFYFNVVIGIVGYILLYLISPFIADFFNMPLVTSVLRVVGLGVIFNSFCIVQNAILTAELNLGLYTKINIISQLICGAIGIWMAYYGYGVWALVVQTVLTYFTKMLLLWILAKWRPLFHYSRDSFNYLWGFGSKLLFANILGVVFSKIYTFVIGKAVGKHELGLYTRAEQLGNQPQTILSSILSKVVVPSMAEYQNDRELLKRNFRKYVEVVSFVIFPLMFLCIALAKPIILILFGENWIESVPYFQILCLGFAWYPLSSLSLLLLQVLGDSSYLLKIEFIKKPITAILLAVGICFGLWGVVVVKPIADVCAVLVNLSAIKKKLDYNYCSQLFDILKYLLISLPIIVIGLVLQYFDYSMTITITVNVVLSLILYLGLNYMLKFEAMTNIVNLIQKFRNK